LYVLTLLSGRKKGYRLVVPLAVALAVLSYLLSPFFAPMRSVFGLTLLIPALWLLLVPFKPIPEYYWISPFLLLFGLKLILSSEPLLGFLSVALSLVPLLFNTDILKRLLEHHRVAKHQERIEFSRSPQKDADKVSLERSSDFTGGNSPPSEPVLRPPTVSTEDVEETYEIESESSPHSHTVVTEGMKETTEEAKVNGETEQVPFDGSEEVQDGAHDNESGSAGGDLEDEEVERTKRAILSKLMEFGIKGEIVRVTKGPVLTLYEFVPAPGVKASSVASREDDLYISLKKPVRVVVPLPNGNIGIEVPNDRRKIFTFKDAQRYLKRGGPLDIPIGVDVFGRPFIFNLQKAPHVLIGGATGSGKSVLLTTMVLSLIKKNTPETLRLVLIDPKMVELSSFEGIPHLILPVAKTVSQAVQSLNLVVQLMGERYALLSSVGARNIEAYNRKAPKSGLDTLPYLVVVIDELADLMMLSPKDTIEAIQRVAQLARAVGIHMVVATQRPSVDVIKPVIKANFPSRIALRVASRFDSRTILDRDGAERLLGKGDMLVLPADRHTPLRVHGYYTSPEEVRSGVFAWIAYRLSKMWKTPYIKTEEFVKLAADEGVLTALFRDDEVAHDKRLERLSNVCSQVLKTSVCSKENLIDTLKTYYPHRYEEKGEEGGVPFGKLDPLIVKAAEVFVQEGYASTSLLQRRLGIGYPRAAKIVDQLERLGFISKTEGKSRPRRVLMSLEELQERLRR